MSRSPSTDRAYAYLCIHRQDGRHEEVTRLLGLESDRCWNPGDPFPKGSRVRFNMNWTLNSGLDDRHSLREHIERLLLYLYNKHPAMQELFFLGYDAHISCVTHFTSSSSGFFLSPDLARQASRYHLGWDFNFDHWPDRPGDDA